MKSLCETLFIRLEHRAFNLHHPVIASEARQSSVAWLDSGLPRRFAPRNDDYIVIMHSTKSRPNEPQHPPSSHGSHFQGY